MELIFRQLSHIKSLHRRSHFHAGTGNGAGSCGGLTGPTDQASKGTKEFTQFYWGRLGSAGDFTRSGGVTSTSMTVWAGAGLHSEKFTSVATWRLDGGQGNSVSPAKTHIPFRKRSALAAQAGPEHTSEWRTGLNWAPRVQATGEKHLCVLSMEKRVTQSKWLYQGRGQCWQGYDSSLDICVRDTCYYKQELYW